MSKQKKTREDASTVLSNYLRKGKDMSINVLPNLKDCLRYGIFHKETDPAYQNKGHWKSNSGGDEKAVGEGQLQVSTSCNSSGQGDC